MMGPSRPSWRVGTLVDGGMVLAEQVGISKQACRRQKNTSLATFSHQCLEDIFVLQSGPVCDMWWIRDGGVDGDAGERLPYLRPESRAGTAQRWPTKVPHRIRSPWIALDRTCQASHM